MVCPVAAGAHVVGGAVAVVAKADLIVGRVEISVAGHQLALARALEAGARSHVDDAVSAVAVFRGETSPLYLDVIDVLGIELRSHVAGNVSVGNRNAVNGPCDLMPAAEVKLVMDHVGAGGKVGDHGQAVSAIGAGSLRDLSAVNQS